MAGRRRAAFERIEADIVTTGALFPLKGLATDPTVRRMTAWLHEVRASVTPFGAPDQRTNFTPDRVAIEKLDGSVVAESRDFAALLSGHGLGTPWGPLSIVHFNGYAMWTYLNTPFLLGMDGVEVVERELGGRRARNGASSAPGSPERWSRTVDTRISTSDPIACYVAMTIR